MKLAIISLNGKSSRAILEECKQLFQTADAINIKKIEVHSTNKGLEVIYEGKSLPNYDCIYIRGSHKYSLLQRSITRALQQKSFMPTLPKAFTFGHNKFLTTIELQRKQVPIPRTYFAATDETAKKLLDKINYPIIIKIPSGTQGKGVMVAESPESARPIIDILSVFKQPYIIQEYVETNATDIRAIVAGNKVIVAMKRKASRQEIRANIHVGGTGQPYELDHDTEQIAINAAKAIGAKICAVDLLNGGNPVVIEVNLSPGLQISQITGKNIAKLIASYLFEKTKKFKENKNISNSKQLITNLDIKAGIIKLPKVITALSELTTDDEVTIKVDKNKITINKHKINQDTT